MRYYTKEWYDLMQHVSYTLGMKKIPDKIYTDEEIQMFYEKKLKKEIAQERKAYNTPPSFEIYEELLAEEFNPDDWIVFDEESEEIHILESEEEARIWLENHKKQEMKEFKNRPPFDEKEVKQWVKNLYKNNIRYTSSSYPAWVLEKVDHRLLGLELLPESIYKELKKEEQKNQRKLRKIEKEAEKVLNKQEIPEEILAMFGFHDANLLMLKKSGKDIEMVLRKDGEWSEGTTPYIRVWFKNVTFFEREKGMVIRRREEEDGIYSNCQYLYDELYRDGNEYEIHMMFWTMKALRYVTIRCEEILFEDNI